VAAEGTAGPVAPDRPVSGATAWLLATRPKTLAAAVAPVLVGTGMAYGAGGFAPLPALAALVGAALIQIGTNLVNDYHDFRRGSDTEARVGPLRVTQAGLIAPERVRAAAIATFGLAALSGVYLIGVAGWPVAVIGLASVAAGFAYTAGPYPLAYHGLGEVFVLVFFGWVAVAGTYFVQALHFRADLLLAGAGVGALSGGILVVNNLRDRETDAVAGKRTLAVVLGKRGSQVEFVVLLLAASVVPALGMALAGWSPWTLLSLAALLPAMSPLRRVVHFQDPGALNPALGGVARALMLYGFMLALGFALGHAPG
jgi:1,4-dihydroxy-2-naphthoate polyprenyltransferase